MILRLSLIHIFKDAHATHRELTEVTEAIETAADTSGNTADDKWFFQR